MTGVFTYWLGDVDLDRDRRLVYLQAQTDDDCLTGQDYLHVVAKGELRCKL
jgi:hypothetical protein